MGFFDKIKNILFEDDDNDTIPVFSKEDIESTDEVKEEKKEELDPIITEDTARFKNVKRDIEFSFDEEELFDEVKSNTMEVKMPEAEVKEEPKQEEVVVEQPKVVERPEPKKDVFVAFDEDEFERLNSRVSHNEEKARIQSRRDIYREYKKPEEDAMAIARRANNNFSSTTPTVNPKESIRDIDRYKISKKEEKKPFTPSPVISPVYGILDKNYTKDSIVEKKGGMKRERIKPVKTEVVLSSQMKKETPVLQEEVVKEPVRVEPRKDIDIDLVRQKAYGALEENIALYEENPILSNPNRVLTTVGEQEDLVEFEEQYGNDAIDDAMVAVTRYKTTNSRIEDYKQENINIEEAVEEDLNKSKIHEYDNSIKEVKVSREEENRSKVMDDLEKTSTLQILDDIEKELSSIKPISKSYHDEEVEEVENEDSLEKIDQMVDEDNVSDDTLESDLFSLIDSMYEQGEEEVDE